MKTLNTFVARVALLVGALMMLSFPALAQVTVNSTTLSSAVTSSALSIVVAATTCTGCTVARDTVIYVDLEAMRVTGAYSSGTTLPVTRGTDGTRVGPHASGATVFLGPGVRFKGGPFGGSPNGDPVYGSCNKSDNAYLPWINITTGWVWACDSSVWRATIPYATTFNSRTTVGENRLPQPVGVMAMLQSWLGW